MSNMCEENINRTPSALTLMRESVVESQHSLQDLIKIVSELKDNQMAMQTQLIQLFKQQNEPPVKKIAKPRAKSVV